MKATVTTVGGFAVVFLVGIASTQGSTIGWLAVGVATVVTLVIALGPERLGLVVLLVATALSPMNRLRLGDSGAVTFADLLYLGAFALLLPRLLRTVKRLPKLYTVGVSILLLNALVVSLLAPVPILSLIGFAKIAWGIIVLPILLTRLNLDRRLILALAWAFVVGQIVSFASSAAGGGGGSGGRTLGLTQHPGFFGLAGQLAVCLCIFLFYEMDRRYRWLVLGAMGISAMSIIASGARASLLCLLLTLVLWPLVERTAMSMYVMLSGAAVLLASANAILANAPEGSALARLQGKGSASGSDLARKLALHEGLQRFWAAPLRGNGFDDILDIHNVYVEVAVGGGIFALVGFLFVLAAVIAPLFRPGVPNRLSYMGVSYAGFALIGPTLYDRVLWGALALAIAGHDFTSQSPPDQSATPESEAGTKAPASRR